MCDINKKIVFFFDLDDTLVDTEQANELGLKQAYYELSAWYITSDDANHVGKLLSWEVFRKEIEAIYQSKKEIVYDYEAVIFEEFCNVVLPKYNVRMKYEADSLSARLYWDFRQTKYQALMPVSRAFDVLAVLKHKGKTCICITRGSCNYQHTKLMLTHLDEKFDSILVVNREKGETKGEKIKSYIKYIMDKALSNKKDVISHEDIILIGDSPDDILAGKMAGINTVRILRGRHKDEKGEEVPTVYLNNLDEMLDKVK